MNQDDIFSASSSFVVLKLKSLNFLLYFDFVTVFVMNVEEMAIYKKVSKLVL